MGGVGVGSYHYRLYKNGEGAYTKCQIDYYVTDEHSLIWFFRLLNSVDLSIVCTTSFP